MMSTRWGVAGPGGIATRFAEAMTLVDDGRIVAVGSRSIERARAFADRFEVEAGFGSYEQLAAAPDIDAVYVATPHAGHQSLVELFLSAGKHVLCEKPLSLNARQTRSMVGSARHAGMFLMEAIWTRFLPSYQLLHNLISEDEIGTPLLVEADFGFRAPIDPEHRLFDRQLGGGALLDLGIYPLQLCSSVLGAPDSLRATGTVGATGVDEIVAATLHHPNGSIGVIKAALRIGMSCTARISGTDGWIDLPAFMHDPRHIRVSGRSGDRTIETDYEGDGLRFEIAEVHRCLRAGLLESPAMPLDETVALSERMDRIRADIGVVYPADAPVDPAS